MAMGKSFRVFHNLGQVGQGSPYSLVLDQVRNSLASLEKHVNDTYPKEKADLNEVLTTKLMILQKGRGLEEMLLIENYAMTTIGEVSMSFENLRLVNDYDFDHDPRTDCCGEIIRIFDYNRLRFAAHVLQNGLVL